jgi:hypothetical protein
VEYAERLARFTEDRLAVHIHISKLPARNRRDHHIRIAATTFESLVKPLDGRIFVLSNSDIVFVCKGGRADEIEKAVNRVRHLFREDMVLESNETKEERFATWYQLESNYPEFVWTARKLLEDTKKRRGTELAAAAANRSSGAALQPIGPAELTKVEAALAGADVSNVLRRQPVCTLRSDGNVELLFNEVYISIPELQRLVVPGIDLAADKWLFQRLTRILDRRVLALLQHNPDGTLATHISLNLNVATVLSPEFLAYDNNLRLLARGTIAIEFQPHDIFSDMGAYGFAHDFLREREYRICVDGLSFYTLRFINREQLGADYLKLHWAPDMADKSAEKRWQRIRALIKEAGTERVILCRCDSEDAIRFGLESGMSLFQGRFVDQIVQRKRPKKLTDLVTMV